MDTAISRNGVPVRLPLERWFHIEENHDELAGRYSDVLQAIEDPDVIVQGHGGEFVAARRVERGKHLVVVYRELSRRDGFVITSYLTSQLRGLLKRGVVWQRER